MGLISLLFSNPVLFSLLAVVLLYSVIAHEISHGYVASLFGDMTAKYSGRLSLNPLSHLDPIGTISLLLVGFGWAKPVPVNYYNLKNFRLGIFCVAFAGVLTNILIATGALLLLQFLSPNPDSLLFEGLSIMARVNIMLGALNLIPIPPLDGSKMVMAFLSAKQQEKFSHFESLGFIILIVLLFSGMLEPIIMFVQSIIIFFIKFIVR